jgi:hypothetical protein
MYGENEIMQIGFTPNNNINSCSRPYVKKGYARIRQVLEAVDVYTRDVLRLILSENNLWHKYLGRTKHRTMICDDPKLYKSILHYTKDLDTTLENRMKYIVEFNYDISKCYCKCGSKLVYGKLYCRKCPDPKKSWLGRKHSAGTKLKMRDSALKLIQGLHGQVLPRYNKSSIKVLEDIARQYQIDDLLHAENGGEYQICGYFVDGYSPSKNIVIEYDEKHHFSEGSLSSRDVERQNNIKKELNCKFIRINYKNEVYYAE